MLIIRCKNCGGEKPHRAKGLCVGCYQKNRVRRCIKCGRDVPLQAKGMCSTCYGKTFSRRHKEAYQARKFYNIDYETYKKKTQHCVICGFDKIVDLHHLDKNHENRSETNLIGLCPNHHKMIHKSEFMADTISRLKEKGYGT
ncbi:hypothetical protein J4462_00055 [Candidatus Pacearchaeota archaeon]|nr:hypothetical protein [Candidatus Pacearchaeota archaeon]